MNLDRGIVTIYRQTNTAKPGELPFYSWTEVFSSYYGERTVGVNRYYTALSHDDQVDMLIEIAPVLSLSTNDRAGIDRAYFGLDPVEGDQNLYFRIVQIQQTEGDDYLPATLLSLERIEGLE